MAEVATLGLRVDGTKNIDNASSSLDRFTKSGRTAEQSTGTLSRESQNSSKSLAAVARESDRAAGGVNGLASAARRAVGVLATFLGARQIVNYADTWTNLTSRIELSIAAHEDAADVMSRLSDISRQTFATFESTAEAFAQNSVTLRALGKSTQEQLNYTEALNNAIAVSGAEGERAQMVQDNLSRAMSEGTLRSEELSSVLNYGSRVAELLADELGVNVTQLRSLAAEGEITGGVIFNALTGNMEKLAAESAGMGSTVRGAMRVLNNSVLETIGTLNQQYEAGARVSGVILGISDAIQNTDFKPLIDDALILASAVGGVAAAQATLATATWAANAAMAAFTKLLRVNPLVLAASAVIALGSALYTARDRLIEIGDTTATVGDYLLATWQEVSTRVSDYWGDALDSVIGWVEDLGIDVEEVASDIQTAFVDAGDFIIRAHRFLFNTVVGIFFAIQTTAVGVAKAVSTAFTTLGENAGTIFRAIGDDITALLSLDFSQNNLADAIENELVSVGGAIANSVRETVGQVQGELTRDYFGDIVGYFDDLGSSIEDRVATNQQIESLTQFSRRLLGMGREATVTGETVTVLGDASDNTADSVDKLAASASGADKEARQFASSLDSLIDTLFPLEAAQRTYREEQEILTRAWNEGTITAERYTEAMQRLERAQLSAQTASGAYGGGGGFGSEIGSRGEAGSPTDPLARNDEDEDYWTKWLESAETALTDFDSIAANTAENFQRGFGDAFEAMVFDSQNFGDAMYNLFDGIARSLVSALGEMAAQWLAYQAVQLIVGKTTQATAASGIVANALVQQQVAGLNAYASTAAIPIVGPVAAPAAMAAAIAATTPSVTAITALSAAGMAHDGIDRIPREGTWLLDQGERVVSRPQADRLDAYLSRQDKPQQAAPVAPVVNITTPPGTTAQTESRLDRDEKWVIDVYVNNMNQGGRADKANRVAYGLSRQGV